MNTAAIYVFADRHSPATDYQTVVSVTRFDGNADGDTVLTVFWTVLGADRKTPLARKKMTLKARSLLTTSFAVSEVRVAEMGKDKRDQPLPENESVLPGQVIVLRKGLKKGLVRKESFKSLAREMHRKETGTGCTVTD